LTGLCVAACRQKRRVRFTTAAGLVNELVEAKHQLELRRVLGRWSRYDLIAIDEVGYVPLAEVGAEFLFQVVAERAEKAAVILTTNCRSRNGRRWFQTRASARRCSTASRIADTFWKRARNPIDSAAPPKNRRKERRRIEPNPAVEMPAGGKPGKPKAGFPLFPPSLEIAARFPHSHSFDGGPYLRFKRGEA
jgi:DNA replication protein DnaC